MFPPAWIILWQSSPFSSILPQVFPLYLCPHFPYFLLYIFPCLASPMVTCSTFLFLMRAETNIHRNIYDVLQDLGTPNEKIWPGYSKLPAVQKMSFTEYPVSQLRSRFGTMITDVGMDLMNRYEASVHKLTNALHDQLQGIGRKWEVFLSVISLL